MLVFLRSAFLAALVLLCANAAWPAPAEYLPGEVIVCYRGQPPAGLRAAGGKLLPALRRVATGPTESVPQALARLAQDPNVAWAEPNYVIRADGSLRAAAAADEAALSWALQQLAVSTAWKLTTGSRAIIVAVVDSGVCLNHADLAPNLYHNPGEQPDGRDDDGNGYVDDVRGWNFVDSNNDPTDTNGHGSFVAGLIGAVDHGLGAAGVDQEVAILPLRVLDASGQGGVGAAVEAISYAIAAGAKVINLSWGMSADSQALRDAVTAAGQAGVVVVCSAGNSSQDSDATPHYPSGYRLPNVIAVAASAHDDSLAFGSNYGRLSVQVAAPGIDLFSTALDGGYATGSGTSFSAALVSGVAALILSYDGYRDLPMAELRSRLLDAADAVPALSGLVASGARVNASRALTCLAPVRATVVLGESLCFHLPGGCAAYGWTVSDAGVGGVEAGVFKPQKEGQCQVRAVPLGGGEALSTEAIRVVSAAGLPEDDPVPAAAATQADSGGGGCFIATAAWGSADAPDVAALRLFRDRCLLTTDAGRAFVNFYYSVSPPLARFLVRHSGLRHGMRLTLKPLVWLCRPLAKAGGGRGAASVCLALAGLISLNIIRRWPSC
jgi:subtilisin family serine protease